MSYNGNFKPYKNKFDVNASKLPFEHFIIIIVCYIDKKWLHYSISCNFVRPIFFLFCIEVLKLLIVSSFRFTYAL